MFTILIYTKDKSKHSKRRELTLFSFWRNPLTLNAFNNIIYKYIPNLICKLWSKVHSNMDYESVLKIYAIQIPWHAKLI